MKTKYIFAMMMLTLAGGLQAARYTVSATESGCSATVHSLPSPSSGCSGSSSLDKSEVEIVTTLTNAGTPVQIFKTDETFDQCCAPAQTYSSQVYNYTEHNSVTTTHGGSIGVSAKGYVEAQAAASTSTTNGASVSITGSAQTIDVPKNSKKRLDVKVTKQDGKKWTAAVQYFCTYKITTLNPTNPCGGNSINQKFEIAGGSDTSETVAVIWQSSVNYSVSNVVCP